MEDNRIDQDSLVEKLGPRPPKLEVLTGFLGDSPIEGHRRLYLTRDLSAYYEFPESAILHHEKGESRKSGNGTTVWLKADTEVSITSVANLRDEQARFLKGSLMATILPRTVPAKFAAPGGGGVERIPTWVICGVSTIATIVITISRGTTDTACCSSCCSTRWTTC